jgi:predicted metal-dependent peptidase
MPMSAADAILRARVKMLLEYPLFGQPLLHLQPQPVTWCATAATDGIHLFYNPEFILTLDRPRLVFLLAHETLHCILGHLFRRGNRDKAYWGMAVDFIVNDVLIKAKIGTFIEGGLHSREYDSDTMTAEEVYDLLERKQVTVQMPLDTHLEASGEGEQGAGDGPPKLTEQQIQDIRGTMRTIFLQAAEQAGKLPAGLQRMLNELRNPKIDWRAMLDVVLRSTMRHDYTYSRVSRRSWTSGLVLPGQDVMDRVVAFAFLDGSSSTTQEMVTDFLSECKAIVTTFPDFELTIATFDTEVYNVVVYTPENADDIERYQFKGGGGTRLSCCWEYLHEHNIIPHQLLIFSDGLVDNDWGEPDYCDTLFIIHTYDIIAPYGVTVSYARQVGADAGSGGHRDHRGVSSA